MTHRHNGTSLFIFRRDLRLEDNTALIVALQSSQKVITAFIIDPHFADASARPHAWQFLRDSLQDLAADLDARGGYLCLLQGEPASVIRPFLSEHKISALYINRDYTPYAQQRDYALQQLCADQGVEFNAYADALLTEPEQAMKKDGTPYTVFTPFYRNAAQQAVPPPKRCPAQGFSTQEHGLPHSTVFAHYFSQTTDTAIAKGDRNAAKQLLQNLKDQNNYTQQRDLPALDATTHLSAHLKFGTCSVREVTALVRKYHSSSHPLLRQLYWRDFFTHIAWHFPRVFRGAFNEKYKTLQWQHNESRFAAWCAGRTGFPIVDAGMRELASTGYMHNRVRMIVASFLTKDLLLDWRQGERWFAAQLIDFDASVNNGNWQWAASTGCDAQPYFRIFNPWLQQKRFDAEGEYIRRWVPELASVPAKDLHDPQKLHNTNPDYPLPIVEHAEQVVLAKGLFRSI